MQEHIYKVIELVGSSEKSIEDAISAQSRARTRRSASCAGSRSCRRAARSRTARCATIRWSSRSASRWKMPAIDRRVASRPLGSASAPWSNVQPQLDATFVGAVLIALTDRHAIRAQQPRRARRAREASRYRGSGHGFRVPLPTLSKESDHRDTLSYMPEPRLAPMRAGP